MSKLMVDSIIELPDEADSEDELESITMEQLKQKYLDLRQYAESKEDEVKVLESIIDNKDEQIQKQQEMIELLQKS